MVTFDPEDLSREYGRFFGTSPLSSLSSSSPPSLTLSVTFRDDHPLTLDIELEFLQHVSSPHPQHQALHHRLRRLTQPTTTVGYAAIPKRDTQIAIESDGIIGPSSIETQLPTPTPQSILPRPPSPIPTTIRARYPLHPRASWRRQILGKGVPKSMSYAGNRARFRLSVVESPWGWVKRFVALFLVIVAQD